MAVNLSPIWGAGAQLLDNSGNVLSGGKIYTYAAGTTTLTVTYTSNTGLTANSNPIVLNSAGRVPYEIWLLDGQNYKFVLKDSNDVLIGTWDNLSGINSNFIAYTNQQEIQTATAGQTVFNLTTMQYLPGTNSLSVFVDGVNQYGPGAQYAFTETDSTTVTFASGLHVGAEVKFTSSQIQNSGVADASQISYTYPAIDAVAQNVEERLAKFVLVSDFGAVCDGVTDDTVAVQNAIDYCATFDQWPTLVIPGKCLLESSLVVDRLVDNQVTEFIILGEGSGAGFYTTGDVTMFTSTLPMTTAPQSEFITFENINFQTSAYGNDSFVLSENFLRVKFINCYFWLIRCIESTTYVQTLYFIGCNIRNNHVNFVNSAGLYDVTFDSCIIENGQTIVRSVDPARGASGLRFINSVIEGIGSSIVVTRGASGFDLIGCHLESNFSPEFNFFASGPTYNNSINVVGNYIYNPNGATFYYGPTHKVSSSGNTAFPNVLHSNVGQVDELVSCGDQCSGGISDAGAFSVVNGVYRAGGLPSVWTDSGNRITQDINGHFGINSVPNVAVKLLIKGSDQTSSNYGLSILDSNGLTSAAFRNDRQILLPALQNFANDTAAAAGGISIGALYRNGSVVQVRVS